MDNSRESSPDWLRAFEAPRESVAVCISSDGQSGKRDADLENSEEGPKGVQKKMDNKVILLDSDIESPSKRSNATAGKKKTKQEKLDDEEEKVHIDAEEAGVGVSKKATEEILDEKNEPRGEKIGLSPIKLPVLGKFILGEFEFSLVSSRISMVLSDRVSRTKALIEGEGDALDMSGDVGVVGRVLISEKPAGGHEMLLDLKGTIYKTRIVPSRTFCIVNFGQTEAKIEAIMNDFIQLQPLSNVYEAETMIEGTLDGFSFDSDEEGDRAPKTTGHQNGQNNKGEDDLVGGRNQQKAVKSSGTKRKKGKVTTKTTRKGKTQVSKKGRKK